MHEEIQAFNKKYKIGDTIKYYDDKGNLCEGILRWNAEPDYNGVVWIAGLYDAVPFKNVIKDTLN